MPLARPAMGLPTTREQNVCQWLIRPLEPVHIGLSLVRSFVPRCRRNVVDIECKPESIGVWLAHLRPTVQNSSEKVDIILHRERPVDVPFSCAVCDLFHFFN